MAYHRGNGKAAWNPCSSILALLGDQFFHLLQVTTHIQTEQASSRLQAPLSWLMPHATATDVLFKMLGFHFLPAVLVWSSKSPSLGLVDVRRVMPTTITTRLTTVSTDYLSLLVAFPFDRLLILINYRQQPTTNRPFLVAKHASSVSSRCSALRSPGHPFTKLLRLAQL
ncbi:hypothetical protein E4U12_006178 [Claviceps purpurea]|nr:hypothetical protein E4U12_006178 [Claviceps purpurea]